MVEGNTHNELTVHGDASGIAQIGTVYGDVYFASGQRAPISTNLAVTRLLGSVAVLAVGLVVLWWFWGQHRVLGEVGFAIGVVLAMSTATVTVRRWRISRIRRGSGFERTLDAAAAGLARTLREQAHEEERLRLLHEPGPLPVRWADAAPNLADHWANIRRVDGDAEPLELAGGIAEIRDVFLRVPSRRLVLLGRGGAGKSVLALRFVLDSLKNRAAGEPVAVIFSLASWNPKQGIWRWAASLLAAQHPELGRTPTGLTVAEELVRTGRILPVLEGFDELPVNARAVALRTLNRTLDRDAGFVLTSRPTEYRNAVAELGKALNAAAVVTLLPLTMTDLRDYLPRTATKIRIDGALGTKWDPVLDRMRDEPDEPAVRALRTVLSTPLMTAMARVAYSDTSADPAVLLDQQRFPTRRDIEDHLLDQLVPTVYADTAEEFEREPQLRWRAEDARRWLGFLARDLASRGTRDVAWWESGGAVPRLVSALGAVVACALAVAMARWVGLVMPAWWFGWPIPVWAAFGLVCVFPLIDGIVTAVSSPSVPRGLRLRGRPRPVLFRLAVLGVLLVLCALGPSLALNIPIAYWLMAVVVVAVLLVVLRVVLQRPVDVTGATGPASLLRGDRSMALTLGPLLVVSRSALLSWPLTDALLCGPYLLFWWSRIDSGSVPVWRWLLSSLLTLVVLLGYGMFVSAWGRFVATRAMLAIAGKMPWRMMSFLADAHRRGVLRQAGGVYQFRHARLQDRLSGAVPPGASRPARPGRWRMLAAVRVVSGVAVVAGVGALTLSMTGTLTPDGPYQFGSSPPVCGLLTTDAVKAAVSAQDTWSRNTTISDDTFCAWDASGPDVQGAILESDVGFSEGFATGTEQIDKELNEAPSPGTFSPLDFGAGSRHIAGICDDAREWIGYWSRGLDLMIAEVAVRCDNLLLNVEVSFPSDSERRPRMLAAAETLAREAVRKLHRS